MRLRAGWPIAFLVALALATAAAAEQNEATPRVSLRFDRVEYDFGTVAQGDSVAADFAFANTGLVPITLSSVIVGCDCEAEIVGATEVAPGGSGQIRFSCDTSQAAGPLRRTATVHSSDVARRAELLTMKGEVVLDVLAAPSRVYLGKVLRGQRRDGVFAVSLGSPHGKRAAVRGVAAGPHLEVTRAKASGSFAVRIAADAPLGPFTENVRVATTSERFPELVVPVTAIVVEKLPERRW